ncbi:MAG: hypothetical protein GQ531_10485 [Sulfurovum sp.]|nr:hypothetical protein [Sulfurovum sp.]
MMINENDLLAVRAYYTIMREKGYFVGYYGSVRQEKLVMEIKEKLGDYLYKAEGVFITFYMNKSSPAAMFVELKGEELMEEIEALCNKNADTMLDILYDNSLPLGAFEYEVLLTGINYND